MRFRDAEERIDAPKKPGLTRAFRPTLFGTVRGESVCPKGQRTPNGLPSLATASGRS